MKKNWIVKLFAVACALGSVPSLALSPAMPSVETPPCEMRTNATVNVRFNEVGTDISAFKAKMDSQIQEIEKLAPEAKIDAPKLQSMNYNINAQNGLGRRFEAEDSDSFRFEGNASFKISPPDKAIDFVGLLIKKGFHATMNFNSFRNGMCDQQIIGHAVP